MLIPFRRNTSGDAPDGINVHFFGTTESRLKCIPIAHVLINTVPGIDTTKRGIWEAPLAGVETVALVNEDGAVAAVVRFSGKYSLTAIAIGSPFVEHEYAGLCEGLHYEQEAPQPKKDGLILTGSLP